MKILSLIETYFVLLVLELLCTLIKNIILKGCLKAGNLHEWKMLPQKTQLLNKKSQCYAWILLYELWARRH